MPTYSIQGPDGKTYSIDGPPNATREQIIGAIQARLQAQPAQAERKPGIIESGVAGAKKLLSSQRTALESPFGTEEAAQAGLARARALEEKTPSALSLEKVKEKYAKDGIFSAAGEVLSQAPSFIAEQLPQLGTAFAGGRLGAIAGAPLGPGGALAGGITGALAPLALQAYGAGAERRAAEGLPQDPGKTALSAAGQAGLEAVAMVVPFGGKLMSRILGIAEKEGAQALASPAARKLAEERLATSIAKGTGKGLLAEIPTEVGQQMLERWQANLPLMDNNAIKEYSEAAYGASLFGGPFGGVGRRAQVGSAKEQVVRADALEAAQKAKQLREEEAAKKADPNYVLDVANRYDEAKAKLTETQKRLKESKPGKDATEGQRDIYEGLKSQEKELIEAFKPVKKEYDEVKGAARALRTSQLPTRPEAAPVVQGNVQQMMDQYREAQVALTPLETQMQEAAAKGDTAAINELVPAYQQQQAQLQELGAQIEALGGTTKAPEVFESEAAKQQKTLEKQIKAAQKKLSDAAETGDFAAMPSLATKLDELKAQQAEQQAKTEQQREALRVNAVPVGDTIPMFSEQAAPQSTEVIKEAEAPAAEKKTSAAIAQREKVLALREQELAELAQIDTEGFGVDASGAPNKPFDAYQRNEYKRRLYEAGQNVEQLQNELSNLKEGKPSGITLDLFSDFNLLNTAIQNRDERTIARMQRAREDADRKALAAASSKMAPREEVYEALKNDINKIVRRERNYDTYEITLNKNTPEEETREIYVSDAVAQEIADLRNTVEKPIGNAKRSMLQIAHDNYAIYEARLTKLEEAKAAKAPAAKINTLKNQVNTALRNYTKSVDRIKPYRDKLDAAMAKLYTTTEVATPRQKAAETAALGKSARETSSQVKQAKKVAQGKVKVSEAKVAQELGETMDEYQAFAAPYQKRLQAKVDQFNKFIATANERLAKLKETLIDAKEVAAVEKQLNAATKARDAIPAEDVTEKDKADKKVTSLKEHLINVKTPKEDKYKLAEANLIKIAKERRAELERLKAELTKLVGEKAVALGKQHPDFKKNLAEAKKGYQESLQDSVQEVKNLRTPQVTRKVVKLGETRTSSTESRAASAARQTAFEAGLSETKGAAYDYQQRQEVLERTRKSREAKAGKGTAMQSAMTKAANAKMKREVEQAVKKEGDLAFRIGESSETVVDAAEAKKLIVEVLSTLPKGVNLVYAPTLADIKPDLLAKLIEGGYKEGDSFKGVVLPDGTIVVVGDQHSSVTDMEETLFHEMVGHYGIDTVIGMDRLQKYANDTDVIKLAEKLGGEPLVRKALEAARFAATQGKSEEIQKLQALREIIAYTAQKRITENFREKAGRWLKEFVGMVRSALRQMGFKGMARMSTSDVFYAIKMANKAFNDRTVGPYRAAGGMMAFRTKTEPSRYGGSFVGGQKGVVDNLRGNMLGLSGRVQFVDQYAALDAAIAKGLDAGVISDLEAEQAGYYLRFGQQANAYATQALTNGPLSLVKQVTKRGMEFFYKSTPGASMTKVAQALEKSGIKNSTELENMFTIYIAGKRAKQVGWNKLNFSDPAVPEADYNRLMDELKGNDKARAAFEEAAKIYKEYNNGLVDFLVQTGYMSASRAAELKAIDYVPFYRVKNGELQLMVDKERPVRIANMKDEPMLHELVGDNTQILPIFTSSAQNAFVLTRMGLRNQMMKDNVMLLGRLGIASKIGKGQGPQGPNTVRYKVKGEDNFAVIDSDQYGIPAELIVKGMEGIKTTIPMAIKIMGMPANVLRKFVTRNPAYAIRQAIRDPLTAWFTTGTDGVPVLNSFIELGKMVAGRSPEEIKLMQAGAISSNVMTGDEQDMARAMRDMSLGRTGWAKLMMKADALAMQGDAATRAVIYKDSLAKGMSEMQAYLRTLESMNFNRRGLSPSMQMLSVVIPFFNAQIQGLDVLYRAFTGKMPYSEQLKIRQKLYTRGLLLAAGTLAYAAAMEDDEAYKRAKPEERLGNWFVYTPFSDEPMKIPIPFELGYLFKALPEAVFNTAAEDERASDITKGMGKLVALSNPFALPAAIKPLTEVVLGKSFFGGDIESKRELNTMMPGERYRDSTTEFAKMLGSVTGDAGLTPIKIDYLIRGYTGALGVAIASLANPILNTEASAVEKPTMKTSKMPFIGGLFQPVEGRGTLDAAYERMLEIEQVQGTFDRLVESGKKEEAKAFVEQYKNKLALASLSGSVQRDLGEFAKLRRLILDSNKTTAEKDVLLEKIDAAQYKMASKFLSVTGETRPQ
jgi:hypothetical protein